MCNESQIRTLLQVLFLINKGEIPLWRQAGEKFLKTNRARNLQSDFSTEKKLRDLLKSPREKKVQVMLKYASVYPSLLHFLFNPHVK